MSYSRYAIYYLPPPGPLAAFGAGWLGWDVSRGTTVSQPDIPGLEAATEAPRRYGFHATLKPPFRLAEGRGPAQLRTAVAELARRTAPAQADGLTLSRLGRFLALTAIGDSTGIDRVAAACVTALDPFRAPAPPDELTRRRKAGLTDRQKEFLQRWGYPFVLDEFRFHLTLTGPLDPADADRLTPGIAARLPTLDGPFLLDEIALVGERPDGRFEELHRFPLIG